MSESLADPRAAHAQALAAQGDWPAAAAAFEGLAADLPAALAAQAWSLAADAWRREDRPVAAARALRAALQALGPSPGRGLLQVQLAAALADAGQVEPALDLASDPVVDAEQPALGLDLRIGLLVERLRLDEALHAAAGLPVPAARDFRLATVHRARGEAPAAAAALDRARAAVPDGPPALAGLRAALAHEAGEQALAAADPDEALAAFRVARAEWTTARRRAGLFRAAAGEVRARLQRGELPLARELEPALEYARDRALPLLEAELLMARGPALARAGRGDAAADLHRALSLARACGALLTERQAARELPR
ncbi:hypothetical protein L6R53_31740 [Myxococcota bacterium]|nr:hypothetical protein [Myxococcota bacterium]